MQGKFHKLTKNLDTNIAVSFSYQKHPKTTTKIFHNYLSGLPYFAAQSALVLTLPLFCNNRVPSYFQAGLM